jgi:hypothetical protein
MEPFQERDVVRQVLGLNRQLNAAVLAGDCGVLERLLSEDLVVCDPSNTIRNRAQVLAIFSSGQVVYTLSKWPSISRDSWVIWSSSGYRINHPGRRSKGQRIH